MITGPNEKPMDLSDLTEDQKTEIFGPMRENIYRAFCESMDISDLETARALLSDFDEIEDMIISDIHDKRAHNNAALAKEFKALSELN